MQNFLWPLFKNVFREILLLTATQFEMVWTKMQCFSLKLIIPVCRAVKVVDNSVKPSYLTCSHTSKWLIHRSASVCAATTSTRENGRFETRLESEPAQGLEPLGCPVIRRPHFAPPESSRKRVGITLGLGPGFNCRVLPEWRSIPHMIVSYLVQDWLPCMGELSVRLLVISWICVTFFSLCHLGPYEDRFSWAGPITNLCCL